MDCPCFRRASIWLCTARLYTCTATSGRASDAVRLGVGVMPGADRIVVHRALRRLDLGPDLEVVQLLVGRDVVARDLVVTLLDLFRLHQVLDQLLGRGLVGAELPDAPEEGCRRHETALRTGRRGEGPAVRRHLRRIALGHRPGRRRIGDQRALAGDQRPVVRRVVEAARLAGQVLDELLRELQALPWSRANRDGSCRRRRSAWHRRRGTSRPPCRCRRCCCCCRCPARRSCRPSAPVRAYFISAS